MNKKKALEDLFSSLEQLETSAELFHQGKKSFYRSVAVQLRLLFCDVSGRKGLIKRIFSQSAFHPVKESLLQHLSDEAKKSLVFYSPATINFDGKGGAKIVSLFNTRGRPLPLDVWLQQPLLNLGINIEELIRSVADKEGAHSDPDYNATLKFTRKAKVINDSSHSHYIIAIGEYVSSQLRIILNALKSQMREWEGK